MTIQQRLTAIAVHPVPPPFGEQLAEVMQIVAAMRDEAAKLDVRRSFTPDGRFLGDVGEVIAKVHFGVTLHDTQTGGQDGTCRISGKIVEVKLRSKSSLIWVSSIPDILVVIYLCPTSLRWGIVFNGPGDCLHQHANFNEGANRFETTLSKMLKASDSMLPGALALQSNLPALAT